MFARGRCSEGGSWRFSLYLFWAPLRPYFSVLREALAVAVPLSLARCSGGFREPLHSLRALRLVGLFGRDVRPGDGLSLPEGLRALMRQVLEEIPRRQGDDEGVEFQFVGEMRDLPRLSDETVQDPLQAFVRPLAEADRVPWLPPSSYRRRIAQEVTPSSSNERKEFGGRPWNQSNASPLRVTGKHWHIKASLAPCRDR
ncbi:hypothetical protein Nepgr_033102 [Nepenthes gracilis]|uniref:Uncharacterized protein n=1 Tax=Nepenthes gracilis TaxID=150966 RepID=A0AAD3Y8F0_NEPGR|nr:hypothetical protein Nepgr_033102 [Nepenthes gracilis]